MVNNLMSNVMQRYLKKTHCYCINSSSIHKTKSNLTHMIAALIYIRYITNNKHGNTQKICRVPVAYLVVGCNRQLLLEEWLHLRDHNGKQT